MSLESSSKFHLVPRVLRQKDFTQAITLCSDLMKSAEVEDQAPLCGILATLIEMRENYPVQFYYDTGTTAAPPEYNTADCEECTEYSPHNG